MNNYAISTSDLAESLTRSSAALVAANNSLEQSIALTAAANTTIQDPESVGNALKVVSMRIRGVKSELEEAGEDTENMVTNTAKLQEKIMALTNIDGEGGINILTESGEFKSTYDILLAISKVWKDMDDTSQASLLELVAGKTRGSVVAALFQNGDVLEEAYASASGASGSAMKELETYLDSIQGKMQQFTNSVQTMWMNLIESDTIKDLVDLGTKLVKLADNVGVLRLAFMALGTYWSMKYLKIDWSAGTDKLSKSFVNLFKSVKSGNGVFDSFKTAFSDTSSTFETVTKNLNDLEQKYENAKAAYTQNPSQENEIDLAAAEKSLNLYRQQTESVLKLEAAKRNLSNAEKALAADSGKNAELTKQLTEDVDKYKNQVRELEKVQQNAGKTGSVAWGNLKVGVTAFAKQVQNALTSMAVMYLISKAIELVTSVFDKLIETVEESKEKFDNLVSELDSTKSGLNDLESKLEDINKQIEEINDNTPLSFTDEEDLKRLKAESAELEQQIKFQKMLADQQQEKVNQEAVKQVGKYKQTVGDSGKTRGEIVGGSTVTGAAIGTAAGLTTVGTAIGSAIVGAIKGGGAGAAAGPWGAVVGALVGLVIGVAGGAIAGGIKASNEGATVGNTLENMQDNYADLEAKMVKARDKALKTGNKTDQEAYEKAQENFVNFKSNVANYFTEMGTYFDSMDMSKATESEKAAYAEYKNLQDKWSIINNGDDAKVNALDRLFGENADEVVKAYVDVAKAAVEAGEAFSFTEADAGAIGLKDDLETLGVTTDEVTDYFTKFGEAGADAVDQIDFSNVISELAKIEGALGSVKSVMDEFRTDGIVSASTLAGMQDEFGRLGEAWKNYANLMMSGTATMVEVQAATEELAKAYLDNNAGNIDKGTRLTYIAQLEQFGFGNAAELVDSYINNSFWNSTEFANFKGSAEELIELAEEYGVTIEDTAKAEELLQAKENVRTKEAIRNEELLAQAAVKYQQQEAVARLGDTTYRDIYDSIVDMTNLTGAFSGYSTDDVQPWLDAKIAEFKDDLEYLFGDEADDMWNALFPDTSVIPEITVSEAEVDKAKKEFQDALDQMKLTVTPEIETADSIDELARFESGMKSLADAYQEYKEEGVVSFGTLSDLGDTFGNIQGVKDEYRELVKLMGTSGTEISAIEAQMERLATAYLSTIDANQMIIASEEERRVVIDNLTRMGVQNAEEIVNEKLKTIAVAEEAYGIDVSNYTSAEAAKLAAALSTVYGVGVANSDLVTDLANKYGIDLRNFVGTENEKIQAAKEAAKAIAKAHRDEQLASLNTDVDDATIAEWESEWRHRGVPLEYVVQKNNKDTVDAINAEYADAIAAIDAIGDIDPNNYVGDAFSVGGIDLDFNLDDGLWTGSGSNSEIDWLDHYFTDIENKIKEKESDLESVMSADIGSIDKKNTIIDGIIGLYESKEPQLRKVLNAYADRAARLFGSLPQDVQDKILNGSTIDPKEYAGETAEKIQEYFDYISKISDIEVELDEIKVTIANFSLQKFENAAKAFDNEIEEKFQSDQDLIEAEIGYLEEQGKRVSPELYEKLIAIQEEEQKVLEEKKKKLEEILAAEIAAGRIQVGSEQWYEMSSAIDDVSEAIIAGKNDIESFQNAINDIYWDNFDKLIDGLDAINSELSHLFDLLSEDDKVVDEFGNWTDEGITSLGLLAQQMENAQAKADEYKKAMDDLEKNKANYSIDEYNEKMAELKDSYLSEIENIEDLKDAMVDLNKVRIDAIKESIDKEIKALEEKNEKIKESLDLEKEQYNWQKQVAEKEKSIADIQRRLNALAGDNSASAIAERRKLQAELAAAQAEMDDMWYEHSIEEQQKALDESLENYKENKEDEKEALDKWLEDEEKVIQESFDLFNSNVDIVSSVLSAFEEEHGVKLSAAIVDPWNSGINAMEAYRQKLAEMKQEQESAKQAADDAADKIINSTDTQQPNEPATTYVSETVVVGSGGGGGGHSGIIDDGRISHHVEIKAYAKGTTGVRDDQWALTDELGDELTLHAGPNGRLQYLTKGSGVVTADLTKRLMEWGELDPSQVLKNSAPKLGAPHITTNNMEINLHINEVVHIDHADSNSIQDITSAVQKQMDQYMKNVNQSLKRFTR